MTTLMAARKTKKRSRSDKVVAVSPLTFMDHVRELQGRLFAVAIVFVLLSAAAYPFFEHIVNFLLAPLGPDHELVYLTPAGAFSFIIQVCLYVGVIGSLPVIIYHLFRFLMPAVKKVSLYRVLLFTLASFGLAIIGILFAYFISLPAALYFLTGFDIYHINPMLTIDSYFSFVMAYMFAGAVLFQLPLVMLIIDSIKPLTPKKLMNFQRHIIVGSFVVAAIISPTPDALNQTLLASPIVVMYQIGIALIWMKHRKNRKVNSRSLASPAVQVSQRRARVITSVKAPAPAVVVSPAKAAPMSQGLVSSLPPKDKAVAHRAAVPRTSSMDGFLRVSATSASSVMARTNYVQPDRSAAVAPARPIVNSGRPRSLDGFLMPGR